MQVCDLWFDYLMSYGVPGRHPGSISVAIGAGVDEAILYLQSGHGQALPARAYMQICAPGRFLEKFATFGL